MSVRAGSISTRSGSLLTPDHHLIERSGSAGPLQAICDTADEPFDDAFGLGLFRRGRTMLNVVDGAEICPDFLVAGSKPVFLATKTTIYPARAMRGPGWRFFPGRDHIIRGLTIAYRRADLRL